MVNICFLMEPSFCYDFIFRDSQNDPPLHFAVGYQSSPKVQLSF